MTRYVLAEHLKEELKGRRIKAAVFHTFNFDSEFFENYLLPLFLPDIPFGDNKIQNTILWKKFQHDLPPITVYCDFHAKTERGIHLDYLVRPIDVPKNNGFKPCYHPKHSYLLLEDDELIIITGSNNLTEAGWCSNLEGVNFFKLKSNHNYPRELKDQFKEFNRTVRKAFFNEQFKYDDISNSADDNIDKFFRSVGYTEEKSTVYFDTSSKSNSKLQDFKSFIQYIKTEYNANIPFEKVEVISPYFPKGISLFTELKEVTQSNDISISLPLENTHVVALEQELFENVNKAGIKWRAISAVSDSKGFRKNHSKIYQFVGSEHVFTVVGSINFTNMAWKGVKSGGNYESAILYIHPKVEFKSLLEDCSLDNLVFTGHSEEENIPENREDVFKLNFVLDWSLETLEIINEDEENQKGKIEFEDLSAFLINTSRTIDLSAEYIRILSNNPIIKVRPSNKQHYFYYYPIHKNIEAKPLPEKLNLSDSELLQLWMDLDSAKDNNATLRIIDSFIDRITDEAGDVIEDELKTTNSTLNIMATHLSGLLKLQKRIFTAGRNKTEEESNKKLRQYYLFAINVDTLKGYRNLIAKMYKDTALNGGFYWLLLNIIDLYFYSDSNEKELGDDAEIFKHKEIKKTLNSDIRELEKEIIKGSLTKRHLDWTLKMLKNDIK